MMGGINELIVALETLSSRENAAPAEVFKAFNDLIRGNSQEVSENVCLVLDKFRPVTRIGRILKIRLVDRCRVHSEVLKLLQSGDSLDTNQALKCRWFFAKLDNAENFVNHTLPTLSHSVRLKVINRYSSYLKDTAAGEALYLSLKSRYGIRDAALLLPACSESFIRDELPNLNGVVLRPNLTLALQKKYPSLATEYLVYLLDAHSPHNRRKEHYALAFNYRPLFQKLSQTDLPAFIDIYEKHGNYIPYMLLGRRTMKMFVKRHFNDILTKFDACKGFFGASSQFYKLLTFDEMKELYVSCILPPTLTEFFQLSPWESPVQVLNDYVKPDLRGVLLQQGFLSKYGRDPFSSAYLSKFRDHWMEILPIESRTEKVEMRLTGVDNPREQAEFLAYLHVDQSIPRMKKLIEAQSDPELRSSIAAHMIKSLRYNKHTKGFKDLFVYFNKRFRNETKQFREHLLSELSDNEKFLLQLDVDDWAPIDELLDIIKLNKEVSDHFWSIASILKTQIHCYFLRNVEIEPHLQKYIEFQVANSCYFDSVMVVCRNTPYQRIVVEWFLKKIPTMEWKSSSDKLCAMNSILSQVIEVNKKSEPSPIVLPEEIILEMEELVKDSELYKDREFHSMLKHAESFPSLRDRLLKIAFPGYMKEAVLSRFLKIHPDLLRDELEQVLAIAFSRSFREYRLFYSKCRLYESYGIPQKLARICRVSLKLEEDASVDDASPLLETSSQPHAVQVLSLVLHPAEYAEIISKYTPAKATIEDYSQEVVETFALQKAICRSLVAVPSPSAMLPLLRKFTAGDYLKIAVGSLNGVCSRVPENEVLPVLKEWTDCPVSLRKHILRLMYRVAPAEEKMEAFVEFFKKEKNSSLRRVIFLEVRRTFITDASEQTFKVMSTIIDLLNDEDEVLKDLISVQSMSSAYISRYLELIWNRISGWESALPNGKTNLIECIDDQVVKSIDDKFCSEVLSHELNQLPEPLSKFVNLCILHAPSWDSQHARLKQVVTALTQFVQNDWNERRTEPGHVFPVRRTVALFVHKLCEESRICQDTEGASKVLNETKTALTDLKELRSSLELFFWLDAYILFLNLQNDSQTSFETALAGLYKTYIERHGTLVPHSLASALSLLVPMVSSRTKLAHELVQFSELPLCQILAARIAEKSVKTVEELPLINSIIETLLSSENPDVQNAASFFFEAVESSLIV